MATNLEITDLSGKLLLTKKLENTEENAISTSNLSSGLYLVSVEAVNGASYTTKLVVQ